MMSSRNSYDLRRNTSKNQIAGSSSSDLLSVTQTNTVSTVFDESEESKKALKTPRPSMLAAKEEKASNGRVPGGSKLWKYLMFISCLGIFIYLFIIFQGTTIPDGKPVKTRSEPKGSVSVMINTFKREELMEDAVRHYSSCELVDRVFVVWSESAQVPAQLLARHAHSSRVHFLAQDSPSLNSRFRPIPADQRRRDAIFATDDDMRVSCADLERAFSVWKMAQRTLVGFMPRLHLRGENGKYQYRCWWRVWWHGWYSMILTKAAMLHHDYLVEYWSEGAAQTSVRALVDSVRNCEDLAMQFLVSNSSRLAPVFVRGSLTDLGSLGGISASAGPLGDHMAERAKCLDALVQIYGRDPLLKSYIFVDRADNWWSSAPSTWMEYISSDLWKFN